MRSSVSQQNASASPRRYATPIPMIENATAPQSEAYTRKRNFDFAGVGRNPRKFQLSESGRCSDRFGIEEADGFKIRPALSTMQPPVNNSYRPPPF